jgi:hypothetical protein
MKFFIFNDKATSIVDISKLKLVQIWGEAEMSVECENLGLRLTYCDHRTLSLDYRRVTRFLKKLGDVSEK